MGTLPRPAAGWEKGQIEKNVRDARHRIWQTEPRFEVQERLVYKQHWLPWVLLIISWLAVTAYWIAS